MAAVLLIVALAFPFLSRGIVTAEQAGSVKWTFSAGAGTSGGSIDNAGPTVAAGIVYFMSAHGNNSQFTTWALDSKAGTKRWRFDPPSSIDSATAPAVGDGMVFFAAESNQVVQLYALDGAKGSQLWSTRIPGSGGVQGPPAVDSGRVFLGLSSGLHAVDAKSGSIIWSNTVGSAATSPAAAHGSVFVSDGTTLHAFDAASGSKKWESAGSAGPWASPVAVGGTVYTIAKVSYSSSGLLALDMATGTKLWTQSNLGDNYNPLAPAVSNGRLFLAGATSSLRAFNATTGASLWTASNLASTHLWSVPTVANGVVYVGSDVDGKLHALDTITGSKKWEVGANGNTVRSPVVADGLVYFGSNQPWAPSSSDTLFAVAVSDLQYAALV